MQIIQLNLQYRHHLSDSANNLLICPELEAISSFATTMKLRMQEICNVRHEIEQDKIRKARFYCLLYNNYMYPEYITIMSGK